MGEELSKQDVRRIVEEKQSSLSASGPPTSLAFLRASRVFRANLKRVFEEGHGL